jgi:hypothetical protein
MRLKPLVLLLSLLMPCGLALAVEKTVYGLHEYARIEELGTVLPAKLDTGAKTASLSAHNIKRFKRSGESWVRFTPGTDGDDKTVIEKPLARISHIKRRAGDYDPDEDNAYTARPVIELDVCMGKTLRTIEVNLTDRSSFEYPLLIGADALKHLGAVVDPSLKYAAGQPACPTVAHPDE